jgi:hypothetical protein
MKIRISNTTREYQQQFARTGEWNLGGLLFGTEEKVADEPPAFPLQVR